MQSGISASAELQSAFQTLATSTTQRGLLATIDKESIVPGATIPSTSTFLSDLSQLTPHLTPTAALYILLRRADTLSSPDRTLIAISYIPSTAPVRQKMLFASTRLTLVRELGSDHFSESVFCTAADELSAAGWEKHVKHTQTDNPLTQEEQDLVVIRQAEALESRGTRGQGLVQGGGLEIRADEEIREALRGLGDGEENFVQLRMDVGSETLRLVGRERVGLGELAGVIDGVEPRFGFYRLGDAERSVVFISTCPSAAKIKARMLYAASRGNVVSLAQGEGVKVAKRLEFTNPDEVTEEAVLEEFREAEVEEKKGFAKPKRPGRR
ncbi:actin depolymerizing protein [Polyplosphaeria fusca]|uniref:Actin depolymerizing protein n=1 Tax=Polyplosphaeria fusca TaxID=682080 RepID=A0A9P4V346_9PLEO|nr:actin depolymerizing protein [Polyplosphaeria fusca]